GRAVEDLPRGRGVEEMGTVGALEFRLPLVLDLNALLLGEHIVLVEIASLAVIAGIFQVAGIELPPNLRSPSVAAVALHDAIAGLDPRLVKFLPGFKDRAVVIGGAKPQLHFRSAAQPSAAWMADVGPIRRHAVPSTASPAVGPPVSQVRGSARVVQEFS